MREAGGTLEVALDPADLDREAAAAHPQLSPGPYIRLTVRDTGHGMPPEVVERIFDPFFTTKRTGEGTGMGLAVVHGIVQRHGGAILVDSEPGRGSTFQVLLPRAVPQDAPGAALDGGEARLVPTGRGHILFVDDERALVEIGSETLRGLGYRVTASTDSLEALGLFTADPLNFDLLVTDQTMPHLSGTGLARQVLDLRPGLPVILCTGFSETVSVEQARAAGIRELLLKPLLKRKLAESVARALDPAAASPAQD
jgi:CheY-like chemotaxis protein